ncbi:hypothetical protein BY996DRAFT_6411090 [Phakopsora pachyrhizi]|nr:hypothetical protein BY996DRAFT_6411090 [Phakopsora pachyrhizi]
MASDDDKDRMIANLQQQLAAATIGDDSFKTPFYKRFMKDLQGVAKDNKKLQRDGSNFLEWRSSLNSCLLLAFPDNKRYLNNKNYFDNLLKHEEMAAILDREDHIAGYRRTMQVIREELGKLKRMGKSVDDSIYVAKATTNQPHKRTVVSSQPSSSRQTPTQPTEQKVEIVDR